VASLDVADRVVRHDDARPLLESARF